MQPEKSHHTYHLLKKMKLAFTLCSNNYLGQAKALGDSLLLHNPDMKFVVGLVDRINPAIDYSFLDSFEVIQVEDIRINDFKEMCNRYDIVELNTAVKPFYFLYLIEKFKPECVYYFDPDIVIFDSLQILHDELANSDIILTPHVLHHSNDKLLNDSQNSYSMSFERSFAENFIYWELHAMRFGLYNLGFIGLSGVNESIKFLEWWKYRTDNYGDCDPDNSLFVDQLWVNFAPILFDNVKILKHYGLNVAHWNIHERDVSKRNGKFWINDKDPLIFFHYSSFSPKRPGMLSKYDQELGIVISPEVADIIDLYHVMLVKNKFDELVKISCLLDLKPPVKLKPLAYRVVGTIVKNIIKKISEKK